MALCVLKWLMLIPVSFAITLASWAIAPVVVCLGWKLWQAPAVGKTCQHTARVAVFKHFG